MITAENILPSVGQTFHDTFDRINRNAFLEKSQEEAQGMVVKPKPPTFKELQNGVDNLGNGKENGITTNGTAKLPSIKDLKPNNTGSVKPDTWNTNQPAPTTPPATSDDLLTDVTKTADSVQADLLQVASKTTLTMSRRNFFIIVALVIFVVLFLVAIFNK
jgi:hypothetical protein